MKSVSFTPFVGVLGACGLFWALYLVFGCAVVEETMLEVQKIFYFHVSSAFVAFTAYAFTCVCSILYLIRRNDKFDALGSASAEIGLVFCTIVLVTGPIWARFAWGTWWNWEARLTSTLILWLMYIGYFILRAMLDIDLRKTYSSATKHAFATAKVSATDGTCSITMTDAVTATLDEGRYVWDITQTDSSGIVTRRIEGRATVTPSVTR